MTHFSNFICMALEETFRNKTSTFQQVKAYIYNKARGCQIQHPAWEMGYKAVNCTTLFI